MNIEFVTPGVLAQHRLMNTLIKLGYQILSDDTTDNIKLRETPTDLMVRMEEHNRKNRPGSDCRWCTKPEGSDCRC
jgi:hypothetical protein